MRDPWPIVNGNTVNDAFATAKQHINNIRNGIYWDNYSTQNPVYWVAAHRMLMLTGKALALLMTVQMVRPLFGQTHQHFGARQPLALNV